MRKLPSPWSIVKTDNVCWGIITSAPVILFFALVIKFTGSIPGSRGKPDTPLDPGVATTVLAGAVALILFLSAIVAHRVTRTRTLFDAGREIQARVRKVKHMRGSRTQLKLEFELHGIPYQLSSTFMRSSRTPTFNEGTQIRLLVDPANPKRAVPIDLYDDSGAAQHDDPPVSAEQQRRMLRLKSRG